MASKNLCTARVMPKLIIHQWMGQLLTSAEEHKRFYKFADILPEEIRHAVLQCQRCSVFHQALPRTLVLSSRPEGHMGRLHWF